jgi:NAD(P)-dependent dehydrogenase (short-subunit alcohol dehydrogenase family)
MIGATVPSPRQALVLGASQGIGLEFVRQFLQQEAVYRVFAVYRPRPHIPPGLQDLAEIWGDRLRLLSGDITQEADVIQVVQQIQSIHATQSDRFPAQLPQLHWVINTVGVLHQDGLAPEKSLRQIQSESLLTYFQVNSIPTVLLAKHLLPLLHHSQPSLFATLSAKVGSITDNQLGGWYGYRASKAALNMFIKTIALEYQRRSPKTIVLALHPGTTDTRLSQPFQANVPPAQLFSVERTVNQLFRILDTATIADSGTFFAWDGSPLPW